MPAIKIPPTRPSGESILMLSGSFFSFRIKIFKKSILRITLQIYSENLLSQIYIFIINTIFTFSLLFYNK